MEAGHSTPLPAKKEVDPEKGGEVSGWLLLTASSTLVTYKVIIDFVGLIYAIFLKSLYVSPLSASLFFLKHLIFIL